MRFYGIYLIIKRLVFESYILPCQALAVDRDGRPDQWSVDRCAQDMHKGQLAWSVDRAVDRLKSTHSRVGPVDRAVDRPESRYSLVQGPVDRAVDRAVDR